MGEILASTFVPGAYLVTNDVPRLEQLIEKARSLSCLDNDKKEEFIKFLNDTKDNKAQGAGGWQLAGIITSIVTGLPFAVYAAWLLKEKIDEKNKNKVQLTDAGKKIRDILAADPEYDIKSAREDAVKFWRRMDSIRFRSLIVSGISGSGKDVRIDEMSSSRKRRTDRARVVRGPSLRDKRWSSIRTPNRGLADKLKGDIELVRTRSLSFASRR